VNRIIVAIAFMALSACSTDRTVQLVEGEPLQVAPVVPFNVFTGDPAGQRDLLLRAAGAKKPEPGQVQIPIPVDGAVRGHRRQTG
jgi:hypothetical protein